MKHTSLCGFEASKEVRQQLRVGVPFKHRYYKYRYTIIIITNF